MFQREIDKEARNYVENKLNMRFDEQTLWNKGGIIYRILDRENNAYSLFATAVGDSNRNYISIYRALYEEGIDSDMLVKSYRFESYEKNVEDNEVIHFVFIQIEEIIPIIYKITDEDEKYNNGGSDSINPKHNLISLYNNFIKVCDIVKYVNTRFPQINVFFNNEEICVNQDNCTKLIIYDMVQNDINSTTTAYELNILIKKIGLYLNEKIDFNLQKYTIDEFKHACLSAINDIELSSKNKYDKFEKYYKLAQRNNALAQYNVGYMYEKGIGVPQNYELAFTWYMKAAKQRDTSALNNLARMYQKGIGVKKNIET